MTEARGSENRNKGKGERWSKNTRWRPEGSPDMTGEGRQCSEKKKMTDENWRRRRESITAR